VRAADAGEPAGTAGKPMLAAIDALGLDCAAVAVVRYFGGTKLGTAGLVRCYRAAAREALEDAGAEQVFDTVEIEIDVPYDRVAQVKRAVEPPEIALIEETFSDRAHFRLAVRTGRVAALERDLEEWRIPFRRIGGA
jgi:putative IMPACT (imprinted ancient) family translation regulator